MSKRIRYVPDESMVLEFGREDRDDIIVPVEHFDLCPIDKLPPFGDTNEWTNGCGGAGLPHGTKTIDVWRYRHESDLGLIRFAVPVALGSLMDRMFKAGEEAKAQQISSALGAGLSLDQRQLKLADYALHQARESYSQYEGDHDEYCDADCTLDRPMCSQMQEASIIDALEQIVQPDPSSLWRHRLTSHSERVFFEKFVERCKREPAVNSGRGFLEHLMSPPSREEIESRTHANKWLFNRRFNIPTHEQLTVAAAFAQWLGTNCGSGYIRECEREIASKDELERKIYRPGASADLPLGKVLKRYAHEFVADIVGDRADQYNRQLHKLESLLNSLCGAMLYAVDREEFADQIKDLIGDYEVESYVREIVHIASGIQTSIRNKKDDLGKVTEEFDGNRFDPIAMGG